MMIKSYEAANEQAKTLNHAAQGRGVRYDVCDATSSSGAEFFISCYCVKHDLQVLEGDSCGKCLLEAGRRWDVVAGRSVDDPDGIGWAIYRAVTRGLSRRHQCSKTFAPMTVSPFHS